MVRSLIWPSILRLPNLCSCKLGVIGFILANVVQPFSGPSVKVLHARKCPGHDQHSAGNWQPSVPATKNRLRAQTRKITAAETPSPSSVAIGGDRALAG